MSFGEVLKYLLLEKGLTQSELAANIGYTQRAISKWVNMQAEPTETAIKKVAEYFDVSVDYLLGRTDELGAVVMPGAAQLTDEERELLERYHALRPDLKDAFWITLNALGGTPADVSTKKKA